MEKIPFAVKKQEEMANKLFEERYGKPAEVVTETEGPETTSETVAPQDGEVIEEKTDVPDYRAMYETEHQRFLTLQGKYNAEIPSLHSRINELKKEIEDLKSIPKNEQSKISNLDEKIEQMRQEYPEIYEGMIAYMEKALSEKTEKIENKVEKIEKSNLEEIQARYIEALNRAVPDWRIINDSPEFIKWLQKKIFGRTRHELLLDAYYRYDSEGTIELFNQFKEEMGKKNKPSNDEKPISRTIQNVTIPKGTATVQKPVTKPKATPGDLAKLYSEKLYQQQRGIWNSAKEAEFVKKERELLEAIKEAQRVNA